MEGSMVGSDWGRRAQRAWWALAAVAALGLKALPAQAQAQETVCARVKIEIKQELTLERQAFDAEMKINNTTDAGVVENVRVGYSGVRQQKSRCCGLCVVRLAAPMTDV